MVQQPKTVSEFIDAIRSALVCGRCGRYIGGLAQKQFKPAPYPVALGRIGPDDEAEALIGFEWHMAGLLGEGKFALSHPQVDGRCVSFREWAAHDDADEVTDE